MISNDTELSPVSARVLKLMVEAKHLYNVSSMYTELPDCGGCGNGIWHRRRAAFPGPGGLDPRWAPNLDAIIAALRPLVDNGAAVHPLTLISRPQPP